MDKKVFLIEPFYAGSHQLWADGLVRHGNNSIQLFHLKGKHWKWRMHGGAISLAQMVNKDLQHCRLIVCTDLMDVALFKSLLTKNIPIHLYFHENQLSYPWLEVHEDIAKKRNYHYSFINYTSALVADKVFFNSAYHRDAFLDELPKFLNMYPDPKNLDTIPLIANKSEVLHLGLDLPKELNNTDTNTPTILWNHRLEYDKNPELFFRTMQRIKEEGFEFKLIILGEESKNLLELQRMIKSELSDEILHWGFVENRAAYLELVGSCHIAPITSQQDFFGISLVESCASGLYPIIPKRLAFEEVLPFEKYYYQKDEDLFEVLKDVLKKRLYRERQNDLVDYVQKYSWPNIIKKYQKSLLQ